MIAIDTNILVYAHRADSQWHERAARCVRERAEGVSAWAVPWACLHEFFAVATHPRIYSPATPARVAIAQVDAWLQSPSLVLLAERENHWDTLKELVTAGQIQGPKVHDARIAALCLAHGVSELWSADRDFGRFPQLTVVNPLAGS